MAEKLVRDRIPEIIRNSGQNPQVRQAGDEEFMDLLKEKLLEESAEFSQKPGVEELSDVLEVVLALTGELGITWEDLEKAGERIWNLTRLYWAREVDGFGRSWDQPSPRFYMEPPATGATAGQITKPEDVQKLLDMYYDQRGWTSDGLPKKETLEKLNLMEFAT